MIRQDLRVGNFLDRNGLMQVESIGLEKISFYDTINKRTTSYFEIDCWLNPIEITEQWLLKFGFEKNNEYSVFGIINEFGRFSIWLDGRFKIDSQDIPKKIKYVHELQNLYFAITGSELSLSGI